MAHRVDPSHSGQRLHIEADHNAQFAVGLSGVASHLDVESARGSGLEHEGLSGRVSHSKRAVPNVVVGTVSGEFDLVASAGLEPNLRHVVAVVGLVVGQVVGDVNIGKFLDEEAVASGEVAASFIEDVHLHEVHTGFLELVSQLGVESGILEVHLVAVGFVEGDVFTVELTILILVKTELPDHASVGGRD